MGARGRTRRTRPQARPPARGWPSTRAGAAGAPLGRQPFGGVDELAAGDQFGDHHADGLEGLHILFVVVARRPVLHDEDPGDPPVAEHRHTHERLVDLLAGFGAVGEESGWALASGKVERTPARGDMADQPLAEAKASLVHGAGVQTLGGEQFEQVSGAHDVAGAHFGDHVGRDEVDDAIELVLRASMPGHDVAEPPQQPPRPADGGAHSHASRRSARAAAACSTSTAMTSAQVSSLRTMPTLCPAIIDPDSTSPSITARRNAPTQNLSMSRRASSRAISPAL